MANACNPSTLHTGAGGFEVKASLGYITNTLSQTQQNKVTSERVKEKEGMRANPAVGRAGAGGFQL